jgi:hypothetical protein
MQFEEVIFSTSEKSISKEISKLSKAGKIRKIAPRIYTPNFVDNPETIVKRNIFKIIGELYPGALLSHRTALEFKPTQNGDVFLTYTYTKNINLPGITLRFLKGNEPIDGDNKFSGELYVAQLERALLENLEISRKKGASSKTLSIQEIEEKLELIIRVQGESGLNEIRDKARKVSQKIDKQDEFEKLNKLISALLSTKPSKVLSSPIALARSLGQAYDPARLELFEQLFIALKQEVFVNRIDKNISSQSFQNFAFFESYFSNYIEGTEFEIDEAREIINTETPMPLRDEDSHDILGTYKIVSNRNEMSIVPENAQQLIDLLAYRHSTLLSARKSKKPGQFKDKNNRAGETLFVDYQLVRGTLIRGFDYYQALEDGFKKALYMMFMLSEIHPFLDGNGRIARVMMNAELVKAGQTKIIIPTVYREDYIGALRKLTRQKDPSAFMRMMNRAWEFSETIFGEDFHKIENHLQASNAFREPENGKLVIIQP